MSGPKLRMRVVQREDGWWIVDVPDSINECGPYERKQDAEEDKRGLVWFFTKLTGEFVG